MQNAECRMKSERALRILVKAQWGRDPMVMADIHLGYQQVRTQKKIIFEGS